MSVFSKVKQAPATPRLSWKPEENRPDVCPCSPALGQSYLVALALPVDNGLPGMFRVEH